MKPNFKFGTTKIQNYLLIWK